MLILTIKVIAVMIVGLLATAFLTLSERKVMAACQRRKGPNVVGFIGLLQPIADGLKLIVKEPLIPTNANLLIFLTAPILSFICSTIAWAGIPFGYSMAIADFNIGILYIFAISSLGVYGIITSGWSSNSKYAFLGSLRSAAQMISYEVSIGLILLTVILTVGSLNLTEIVLAQEECWFAIAHWPALIMFFIACLAETNRAPFDLPEAEAELVAGYFTEYSSSGFSLFFLAEYGAMILMSTLVTIFFLGGWLPPFNVYIFYIIPGPVWLALKTLIWLFLFIFVRACLPRYRYDRLMVLGWKVLLPISLAWFLFTTAMLYSFELF
uniref:NADH-ubiquinone oxidoreductase chain 1 n=1 Tax=Percursaria percursa TaxID=153906 RepID=A0A8K1JAV4_9CHLO|nr:NADH dehydrogenase subunit 1 [Percursaria percursa]